MHPIDPSAADAGRISSQMRLRSEARSPERCEGHESRTRDSDRDRHAEGAQRGVARAVLHELRARLQLSDDDDHGDDDRDRRELTTARIARALRASLRSVAEAGDRVPASLEAIEAGLASARCALARRGLDSDDIERTLGDFREELADQIDAIAAQEAAAEPFELSALQAQYRRKESTSLVLHTVDGDRVRIRIRSREEIELSGAELSQGDLRASLLQLEQEGRLRVQLDVDGSLSAEETQAIQDLVSRAEELANDFFGSDLAAAFDPGSALDFDATQIADYRLRLSVSERFRIEGLAASRPAPQPPAPGVAPLDASPGVPDAAAAAPASEAAPSAPASAAAERPAGEALAPAPTGTLEQTLGPYLQRLIDAVGPSPQAASLRLTQRSKLELVIAAFDRAQPTASDPRPGFALLQRLFAQLRGAAEAPADPQPPAPQT